LSHIFQAIFYVSGLSRHNKVSQKSKSNYFEIST
jgi:hypothetical protein